jgi:predicted O-methyltransferase YrrM
VEAGLDSVMMSPADGSAWADGFGIVAPDVARYVDVLRAVPDPVLLAMRNVAAAEGLELLDADAATLLSLLTRSHRPRQVLEVGTGLGLATLLLARAAPSDCTITSIEANPVRQSQAHAFLERDDFACAAELRLGDPLRVLREGAAHASWDMVVLTDSEVPRLDVIDMVAPRMEPDALLVVPWALRGGRVADNEAAWNGDRQLEQQRLLNRCIATDPRFADVTVLPVGDGLLLARRV